MEIIVILVTAIAMLIVRIIQLHTMVKISYSNYQNCLLALAEYDPEIKKYMEGKNERK